MSVKISRYSRIDSLGASEFLDAYKASQGICLPHFFILEQSSSSHRNFPLLLEVQLVKAKALRDTLEEFIRKQDFRLSDQVTPEENTAWKRALDMLAGRPGMFANEMGHDLFQRSHESSIAYDKAGLTSSASSLHSFKTVVSELKTAEQVSLYLKEPLPPDLFNGLQRLAQQRARGAIEATVEDLADIEYLRRLYSAGFSLFYGIGMPSQTIVLLDRKTGFVFEENRLNPNSRLWSLKSPENVYLNLLWHRFGIAVLLSGSVKETDASKGLFCLSLDEKREQWCRFKDREANKIPGTGTRVEVFGWEKWSTQIIEILELEELTDNRARP